MNIAPLLTKTCWELNKAVQGYLDRTQLDSIKEYINNYTIAAAIQVQSQEWLLA